MKLAQLCPGTGKNHLFFTDNEIHVGISSIRNNRYL
jgi:hypothetical protein